MLSRSYYKTTEMIYKVILNFIGLHLKTEINEALVTNSKHHRSPYISTTFMRFPCRNQGKLRTAIEKAFSSQRANVTNDLSVEQGHGRIESRQCYVFDSAKLEGDFSRWKGLKSIVMVENFRLEKGKSVSLEYRYYISSKALNAEQASMAVREHWAIESMHWILDVSMNEDACQIYKDHGAENLSCLRHMSLNMLRAEPTKLSIVGKQKRCMMNTSMLEAVLKAGLSQPIKN